MRTRLLASFAVLAAALLVPSAALAAGQPVISSPGAVSATNLPPTVTWADVGDASLYHVRRAVGDCASGPVGFITPTGGDVVAAPGVLTFTDDSPLPAQGTYCYLVQSDDGIITDSDPVTITFDTGVPGGSLTAPTDGATLTTPVNVTASASDTVSGVASVTFQATPTGLTLWSPIGTSTSMLYGISWTPADGTYDIRAVITDNAGNPTTTAPVLGVLVDGTDPTAAITSPAGGAILHGSSNALSADAADDGSGVSSVRFERSNGGGWATISTDTISPYTADWNTTGLDGSFNVRVVVTDAATNEFTSSSVAVTVDNTAPSSSLTAPLAAAKVRGTIVADATASDVGGSGVVSVAFQSAPAGSGSWTTYDTDSSGPSPYHGTLDTTTLGDGLYDLRVLVTDGATNNAPSGTVANVRVDNTVPTGALTAPVAGTVVHGSTINADATASDGLGSGVTSVIFQRSPAGAATWTTYDTDSSGPSPYHGTLDTMTLGDGLYDLRVLVTDGATNSAPSATVASVRVDNTAPTVSVAAPAASAFVRGATVVSANAADAGSGVTGVSFEVQLGAGAWVPIGSDSGSPYSVPWNTTVATADGVYNVRAIATDAATLSTTSTVIANVRVDNTPPTAPSPAPIGLSPVSATPTITFNAGTDALSGLDHYDVYRDAVPVQSVPDTGALSYNWADTGAVATNPPSAYSYTVRTVDKAGNTSGASGAVLILLDATGASAPTSVAALATPTNQHPQLSWVAPAGYAVDHYKVYRNSVFLSNVASSQTSFTDVAVGEGTWSYQVRAAADAAPEIQPLGVVSASISITYDTTAPTAPGGVAAAAALDGSININWAAASDTGSGVARYVVRRALSASAPATIVDGDASCQGTATSCADATALNGKLYSYAVFTVDRAGNTSAAGIALAVTARDQVAPAVPKGLAATPGDASVDLRWTAAAADDDVAGYVLVAKQGTGAPASESDGTRVCSALVAASTACTATGLTNGATYTFGLFALDEALNRSPAAVVSAAPNGHVTDVRAPAAVTRLNAKVTGHTVTLTWKNPADRDFDHVLITASERKPAGRAASKRVYSGKGTKATTRLAPGQSRWFVVVAYDAVGNASAPATVRAAVAVLSRFGPAPRAKVHGKVRLTWPGVKRAKYYNVQIYAGKRRILVSWPAGRALQLPRAKLKRGTRYTWYVWPGLGAKAKAHYGKLIGKNVFTFTG